MNGYSFSRHPELHELRLCQKYFDMASNRLAYKSSLESAKRDRQSSSERARSASERELAPGPFNEKRATLRKSRLQTILLQTMMKLCPGKGSYIIYRSPTMM